MTILITGACGFIGSHVTQKLLQRGDEVIALDHYAPNYSRARTFARSTPIHAPPHVPFLQRRISVATWD